MNNENDKKDVQSLSLSFFDKLKWLTSTEAAFLLRTSAGQIRNMVWSGKLKAYRFGSRLRFLRTDVEQLLRPAF